MTEKPARPWILRLLVLLPGMLAVTGIAGYFAAHTFLGAPDLSRPAVVASLDLPPSGQQRVAEMPPAPTPPPRDGQNEPAAAPIAAYEEPLPAEVFEPEAEPPIPAKSATPPPLALAPASETPPPGAAATATDAPQGKVNPPRWMQAAATDTSSGNGPMIAIVIDDMGIDHRRSQRIWELPAPLTLAFLTYADDLAEQTGTARGRGHELLLHVPMEPSAPDVDAGPNVLLRAMPEAELKTMLEWGLSRFDGYIGINNHMGSRFTEDADAMRVVLEIVKARDLLFLDSRTSGRSVAGRLAHEMGVASATRNVFIDNDNEVAAVDRQLAELAALARRRGSAIAIGHPKDATLEALARWLPQARAEGFRIVPLSALIARRLAAQAG